MRAQQNRLQARAWQDARCIRGHLRAEHGRQRPDGTWVGCRACEAMRYAAKKRGLPLPKLVRNARRNLCKHGHAYTPENTYIDATGRRHCIACRDIRCAKFYAKTKAARTSAD
jgi:hypothetical protein